MNLIWVCGHSATGKARLIRRLVNEPADGEFRLQFGLTGPIRAAGPGIDRSRESGPVRVSEIENVHAESVLIKWQWIQSHRWNEGQEFDEVSQLRVTRPTWNHVIWIVECDSQVNERRLLDRDRGQGNADLHEERKLFPAYFQNLAARGFDVIRIDTTDFERPVIQSGP